MQGIIDGYTAIHAHHWLTLLTKKAEVVSPTFQLAPRNGSNNRVEQMIRMHKVMKERGTRDARAARVLLQEGQTLQNRPLVEHRKPKQQKSILQLKTPCTKA
jgi:hypothetical protein